MCYSVFKQSFPEQKKQKLLYGIRCELELRIPKLEIARALKTSCIKQLSSPSTYLCVQKGLRKNLEKQLIECTAFTQS